MPTRPRSAKHDDCTKRQGAFAHEFVRNGGKRSEAAIAAGYAPASARIEAHRLLQKPAVLAAVRREAETALHANVALGQHVLADLAENAASEPVRLAAAQALLDRGGMQLVKRSEQTITVQDNRTDAELLAHAERLARDLGMTIDGTSLIRQRPSGPLPIAAPTPRIGVALPLMGSQIPAAKNLEASEIVVDLFS